VVYEWHAAKAKAWANMKKASAKRLDDSLRPEYDLSQLKGGARGQYYRQAAGPARRRHGAPGKRKRTG